MSPVLRKPTLQLIRRVMRVSSNHKQRRSCFTSCRNSLYSREYVLYMFTLWVFVSFSQMLSPWPLISESSPVVCHSEHQWLIETRTCLDRQQAFHIHLSLACGGVRVHLTSLKLQDCNMQDFPSLPSSLSPNNQDYCCVSACEKALQATYLCTCSILFMVPSLLCCKTTSALLSLAII